MKFYDNNFKLRLTQITDLERNFDILAVHSLAAASWPRFSETESQWFVFETSCYAFGGRIRRFAKVSLNKLNLFTVSY